MTIPWWVVSHLALLVKVLKLDIWWAPCYGGLCLNSSWNSHQCLVLHCAPRFFMDWAKFWWSSSQTMSSQIWFFLCDPGSHTLFWHPSSNWSSWFQLGGLALEFSKKPPNNFLDPFNQALHQSLHLDFEHATILNLAWQLLPLAIFLLLLMPQRSLSWPSVSSSPYSSRIRKLRDMNFTHLNVVKDDGDLGGEVSNNFGKVISSSTPLCSSLITTTSLQASLMSTSSSW